MKNFGAIVILSMSLIGGFNSFAAKNESQVKAELENLLDRIDEDLREANKSTGLDAVEHIAWRTNVMRTMAKKISYIANIMDGKYPELSSFTRAIEAIDRSIGGYRSIREAAEGVGTPEQWKREKESKENLLDFLKRGKFIGANYAGIQGLKDQLNNISWSQGKEDRNFVLEGIASNLDRIAETDFDMHQLQGYGGLHSYRAQTRSFTHQISGVSSFFNTNDPNCPHEGNRKDPEVSAAGACRISACVYQQISTTKDQLGGIKDLGERYENMNPPRHLSKEDLAPAVRIYKFNKDNKVLESAARQIRNCM